MDEILISLFDKFNVCKPVRRSIPVNFLIFEFVFSIAVIFLISSEPGTLDVSSYVPLFRLFNASITTARKSSSGNASFIVTGVAASSLTLTSSTVCTSSAVLSVSATISLSAAAVSVSACAVSLVVSGTLSSAFSEVPSSFSSALTVLSDSVLSVSASASSTVSASVSTSAPIASALTLIF